MRILSVNNSGENEEEIADFLLFNLNLIFFIFLIQGLVFCESVWVMPTAHDKSRDAPFRPRFEQFLIKEPFFWGVQSLINENMVVSILHIM